jgi:hypothetical protein
MEETMKVARLLEIKHLFTQTSNTLLKDAAKELIEEVVKLSNVIDNIATQKIGTDDDLSQEEYESFDFEDAYVTIAEMARSVE